MPGGQYDGAAGPCGGEGGRASSHALTQQEQKRSASNNFQEEKGAMAVPIEEQKRLANKNEQECAAMDTPIKERSGTRNRYRREHRKEKAAKDKNDAHDLATGNKVREDIVLAKASLYQCVNIKTTEPACIWSTDCKWLGKHLRNVGKTSPHNCHRRHHDTSLPRNFLIALILTAHVRAIFGVVGAPAVVGPGKPGTARVLGEKCNYLIADNENNRIQNCPASPGEDCTTDYGDSNAYGISNKVYGLAVGKDGDYVIAPAWEHRIEKCSKATPGASSGACEIVAGGSQGSGLQDLNYPYGIAIVYDPAENYLIADRDNNRILNCSAAPPRECIPVAGIGAGAVTEKGAGATQLNKPTSIATDGKQGLLIADTDNHRVQLCPAATPGNACKTVGGTGGRGAGAKQLRYPRGIALYRDETTGDNWYLIADHSNDRVQMCPAASPGDDCITVAGIGGKGQGLTQLDGPSGIAVDGPGPSTYFLITDSWNNRVQKCNVANPEKDCVTVVGTGARGSGAKELNKPQGIVVGCRSVGVQGCASGSWICTTGKDAACKSCVPPCNRTSDRDCNDCNAGYYLSGTSCQGYSCSLGSGTNCKTCLALEARTANSQCSECNAGYALVGTSCQGYICLTGSGASCKTCLAPQFRTADSQCSRCNVGYALSGTTCQSTSSTNVTTTTVIRPLPKVVNSTAPASSESNGSDMIVLVCSVTVVLFIIAAICIASCCYLKPSPAKKTISPEAEMYGGRREVSRLSGNRLSERPVEEEKQHDEADPETLRQSGLDDPQLIVEMTTQDSESGPAWIPESTAFSNVDTTEAPEGGQAIRKKKSKPKKKPNNGADVNKAGSKSMPTPEGMLEDVSTHSSRTDGKPKKAGKSFLHLPSLLGEQEPAELLETE